MGRKRSPAKPGEQELKPRDVSAELSKIVGTAVSIERTKAVAALAYKWLLEHKNTLLYSITAKDAKHFVISWPPQAKTNQEVKTAEDLADWIVEDHLGGATPNPGS